VKVEKPDGLVQFTIEAGAVNSLTLGNKPKPQTAQKWYAESQFADTLVFEAARSRTKARCSVVGMRSQTSSTARLFRRYHPNVGSRIGLLQ
jgi:hypothetical protein